MSVCNELKNNIGISSGKISSILGTSGDDFIKLECLASTCKITVNDVSCVIPVTKFSLDVNINGLGGDDGVELLLSQDASLKYFNVDFTQGSNTLNYSNSNTDYSRAKVKFGSGDNHVYLRGDQDNHLLVDGLRNVDGNKIHILNVNASESENLEISSATAAFKTYDISLNEKHLITVLNNYSLKEEEVVLQARAQLTMGNAMPAQFVNSHLDLYNPPELNLELVNAHLVFEQQS